jgi:Ca-activated chloride channel family protein
MLAAFCPHHDAAPAATPLNLKILVDCSGSMNGDRIAAARSALHEVLAHLEDEDSFSYSCFGSDVRHFSQSLMAATPRALLKASGWIDATQASMGGTEMKEAMLSTFALGQPFPADILLITDGDIWETDALVAAAEGAGQRVFAVGIGSAPASGLLHRLAGRTGGACEPVADHTEVPGAVMRMFGRMRQPPVRDVTVEWDGDVAWQTAPVRAVPAGDTVHHLAGFAEQAPVRAVLGWLESGSGRRHRQELEAGAVPDAGDTLARVAAAMRMEEAAPPERHALALRYGLVGTTTNLVLVHQRDEAAKPAGMPQLHTVEHSVPAGWAGFGHGAAVPSGIPAVWRREPAPGMLRVSQEVETYDIPEFLRKKPEPVSPYLYRDSLRRLAATLTTGRAGDGLAAPCPVSLDALAADLPDGVIAELRLLVGAGFAEADVIRAFMSVLAARFRTGSLRLRVAATLRGIKGKGRGTENGSLERRIEALVTRLDNACEVAAA